MTPRKPSPNSLQGFTRTDTQGGTYTTMREDVARTLFGLTAEQVDLVKAGHTVTLKSGSTVKWKA